MWWQHACAVSSINRRDTKQGSICQLNSTRHLLNFYERKGLNENDREIYPRSIIVQLSGRYHQPIAVHCWTKTSPVVRYSDLFWGSLIQLMSAVLHKSSLHLTCGRPTYTLHYVCLYAVSFPELFYGSS